MDSAVITSHDKWVHSLKGVAFHFKEMELEGNLDFKSRHPSNSFIIHSVVVYDGVNQQFPPSSVRYARKNLHFLFYSILMQ